jgi:hypothetical protein
MSRRRSLDHGHPAAQGCPAGTTPGTGDGRASTPNGVAAGALPFIRLAKQRCAAGIAKRLECAGRAERRRRFWPPQARPRTPDATRAKARSRQRALAPWHAGGLRFPLSSPHILCGVV